MSEIAMMASILTSLRAATDIAKALRQADVSVERAEIKLRLAEMLNALADAKLEVTGIQQTIADKDSRIAELEAAFQSKDAVVKRFDAFYHLDEKGNALGEPFCLHCWTIEQKKRHLHLDAGDRFTKVCVSCKRKYEKRLCEYIDPA